MILLNDLQPLPLVSLGLNPDSDIFATECDFAHGRRYLVSAPSGRGKSTLLHCIYGLRRDYTGSISIDGHNISTFSPDDWADKRQQDLAIVFQDLRLFPQLSGLENIRLHADLNPGVDDVTLRHWAHELQMDEEWEKPVQKLSYGQRQRIAILRALSRPFRYLLLDEPFSHLDARNSEAALHLVLETCTRLGAGLIMASLGETFGLEYECVYEI